VRMAKPLLGASTCYALFGNSTQQSDMPVVKQVGAAGS
jgi:hypothetical protein